MGYAAGKAEVGVERLVWGWRSVGGRVRARVLWGAWRAWPSPTDTEGRWRPSCTQHIGEQERVCSKLSAHLTADSFLLLSFLVTFLLPSKSKPSLKVPCKKNENMYILHLHYRQTGITETLASPNGFLRVLFDSLALESQEQRACTQRLSI